MRSICELVHYKTVYWGRVVYRLNIMPGTSAESQIGQNNKAEAYQLLTGPPTIIIATTITGRLYGRSKKYRCFQGANAIWQYILVAVTEQSSNKIRSRATDSCCG